MEKGNLGKGGLVGKRCRNFTTKIKGRAFRKNRISYIHSEITQGKK